MNEMLAASARKYLLDNLKKLPEKNLKIFKLMYSLTNVNIGIEMCVHNMLDKHLDWAMTQVKNTLEKQEAKDD